MIPYETTTENIPEHLTFVAGTNMMHTARAKKIPFGVVKQQGYRKDGTKNGTRTLGIVIDPSDEERYWEARKASKWVPEHRKPKPKTS